LIDIIGQILSYVKFFEVIMINAVFNSKPRTQHLHYEFCIYHVPTSIKARAEDSFAITLPLVAGGSLRWRITLVMEP